jgi:hypothetical protein
MSRQERLATYHCEHEKRIGQFATFFPPYKMDELEKVDAYKKEKTLFHAYLGMAEVLSCSRNTGMLTFYHLSLSNYTHDQCNLNTGIQTVRGITQVLDITIPKDARHRLQSWIDVKQKFLRTITNSNQLSK